MDFGSFSAQGDKKRNEDRVLLFPFPSSSSSSSSSTPSSSSSLSPPLLFGVLDGHGEHGEQAADYVTKSFLKHAGSFEEAFSKNPEEAFRQLFASVETDLLGNESLDCYISGTTVCLVYVSLETITVAHVGDTRAVLGVWEEEEEEGGKGEKGEKGEGKKTRRKLKAKVLTKDHTLEVEEEKERVLKAGGNVMALVDEGKPVGPLRVFKGTMPYPGLVVTRSIGDNVAHKLGVIADPEISSLPRTSNQGQIVVASDGLWDLMSPRQVLRFLYKYEDLQEGTEALVESALKISRGDNTTAIVGQLNPPPDFD